jgi:hypothetical protein
MLAALQGSGFARLLLDAMNRAESAYQPLGNAATALTELSSRAAEMAAHVLREFGARAESIVEQARRFRIAVKRDPAAAQNSADAVAVAHSLARTSGVERLSFRKLIIDGAMVGKVSGEDVALDDITFRSCSVEEVVVEGLSGVSFEGCMIAKVSGASDAASLPAGLLVGSEVDRFDNMSTNNAIQQLSLSPELKALLITLRKLYLQPGAGRNVSALHRGMSPAVSKFVPDVIRRLQSHQLIGVSGEIVYPIRRQTARVHRILGAPSLSDDSIVQDLVRR